MLVDTCFPACNRVHLVGDDRQLPPTLSTQLAPGSGPARAALSAATSLFEAAAARAHVHALEVSHRLPRRLARFISTYVYYDRLTSADDVAPEDPSAVAWVDVPCGAQMAETGGSLVNREEAAVVIRLMAELDATAPPSLSRVVLTPYLAQRALLERTAPRSARNGGKWAVSTADAFQGREADLVIISLVRTTGSAGFLADVRRANVLLTRCRGVMRIVGHRAFWGSIRGASFWPAVAGAFPAADSSEPLKGPLQRP